MAVAKISNKSFTVIWRNKIRCLRLQWNLILVIINTRHSLCNMYAVLCLSGSREHQPSKPRNGAKYILWIKITEYKRAVLEFTPYVMNGRYERTQCSMRTGMGRFYYCKMSAFKVWQSLHKEAISRTALWNTMIKLKRPYTKICI